MQNLTNRVDPPEQQELWDELKVEHHWFHVVRSMIVRDKIAEMGVHAWAVYTVLKAYTALNTGKAWPSQDTIAKHIGVSLDTVYRALDRLTELNIVERTKVGRRNNYSLKEIIPMTDPMGEVKAVGEGVYQPMMFASFIKELQHFAKNGRLPNGSEAKITLNVNIINSTGDNATFNIQQVTVTDPAGGSNPQYDTLAQNLRRLGD
jgi:DNA-binding transcriptional MocR family regulator